MSNARIHYIKVAAKATDKTVEKVTEYFDYLDKLREEDPKQVNLFSSMTLLMNKFNVTREEAGKVAISWVESYGK